MNPRRLSFPVRAVAIAVVVALAATSPGLMAQDKPQQPAADAPKPVTPDSTVAAQPAAQTIYTARQPAQATPAQQPAAQPEMGPPTPGSPESRLVRMPPTDIKRAQPARTTTMPATPQPTVQLKPGEVPGIRFDTADYDFGRIPIGQDITHDFWFTNTGNGPLEIISAKPS